MKSVLRSIKPYWLYLILIGKKTVEVGKDCPKSNDWNGVVELYCSKDKKSFNRIPEKDKEWMQKYLGKVVCRFVCDRIDTVCVIDNGIMTYITVNEKSDMFFKDASCLDVNDLEKYLDVNKDGYAWHISDLVIYDEPKELSEFKKIHRECWYADLGLAKRDCPECRNKKCFISRPPQSWCYVEYVKVGDDNA